MQLRKSSWVAEMAVALPSFVGSRPPSQISFYSEVL